MEPLGSLLSDDNELVRNAAKEALSNLWQDGTGSDRDE